MNWSRENRRQRILSKNGSRKNIDDYTLGLNPNQEENYNDPPSPSFKTPQSIPMEKIVILNNNEYVEKLHLPSYKARIVNRSNEAIPSIKKSTSKNSKSEEKLKSEYINIADERKIKRE